MLYIFVHVILTSYIIINCTNASNTIPLIKTNNIMSTITFKWETYRPGRTGNGGFMEGPISKFRLKSLNDWLKKSCKRR